MIGSSQTQRTLKGTPDGSSLVGSGKGSQNKLGVRARGGGGVSQKSREEEMQLGVCCQVQGKVQRTEAEGAAEARSWLAFP